MVLNSNWQVTGADVKIWQDAPVEMLYQAQSIPVREPMAQESAPVQLFGTVAVESCACRTAAPAPDEEQQTHHFPVDTVLFAGGPVWALGWCPLLGVDAAAGPVETVETLAITTHPKDQRRNPTGLQHVGPGAVQLWAVPSCLDSQQLPGGMPKLLSLLWHEGRLAWDVQWCPDPCAFIQNSSNLNGMEDQAPTAAAPEGSAIDWSHASTQQQQQRAAAGQHLPLQGLLAAVLGNGAVVVWAVPTIRYLLDLAASSEAAADGAMQTQNLEGAPAQGNEQQQQQQQQHGALSLQMKPLMVLAASAVGGSLASCCRWLPAAPHDQMLVGSWDGQVAIWKLPTSPAGGQPEPIQLLRADPAPIRCVAWQPDSRWWLNGSQTAEEAKALLSGSRSSTPGQAAGQPLNRSSNSTRHFITVSGIGAMKVWDTQDVLQPCLERLSNRQSLNSCVWLGPPHVAVTAGADGQIRQTWLDPGVQATNTPTVTADVSGSCGSIWSVCGCEAMAVVAFVADGGLLGVMPLEPPTGESRHRKSHAAVSAVAVDGDQLWLLSAREIPGNGGLYTVNPQYWKESKGKKNSTAADAPATVVLDPLPHPDQVLYAVSFSPNYRGVVMLAYGGGAGLVRLHLLSAEVVPVGA